MKQCLLVVGNPSCGGGVFIGRAGIVLQDVFVGVERLEREGLVGDLAERVVSAGAGSEEVLGVLEGDACAVKPAGRF